MPFELIQYDSDLLDNQFVLALTNSPYPVDGFLETEIKFQFPPTLSSDQKSANWETKDVKTYEPIMIWNGASARKIVMNFVYIVTGGQWTVTEVNKYVQSLKAYFYRSMTQTGIDFIPHVQLKFGKHIEGSDELSTWIIEGVQINPSGPLVYDDSSNDVLHLKNEVVLTMMLASQITPQDGTAGFIPDTRLIKNPTTVWY